MKPGENVVIDITVEDFGIKKELKKDDPKDNARFEKHNKYYEIENLLNTMLHEKLEPLR